MYRLLSASKDSFITDRIISSKRTTRANMGQAGTLDLFKLYNETTAPSGVNGPVHELSRLLVQFDYSEISSLNLGDPSFTASLVLKDVYGGQTTPSNFTLVAFPLSKSWDEGRGFDVTSFRDIDTVNFESASVGATWSQSGASNLGTLGADVDTIVSGDLGSGLVNLGATKTFQRGDEDALFDVTTLVSASVAGLLTNNGFRVSFTETQEQDSTTRFVKRFGSRHTFDTTLHPKLIIEFNDRTLDTSGNPQFGVSQSFFTYNTVNGNLTNLASGGLDITGSNSLILQLATSKSVQSTTSSFQSNFSASITHLTRSVTYFSQSFSASQYNDNTGIYTSNFMLDLSNNSELASFVGNETSIGFDVSWKSLDGTYTFSKGFFVFNKLQSDFSNVDDYTTLVVTAPSLKPQYTANDQARIRVFVQDRAITQDAIKIPNRLQPRIIPDMRWRLIKPYSDDIIIPFAESTRMSTDRDGMYFDLFIQDLDVNEVYELEFLIKNDSGKDFVVQNKGFIFKVVD